MDAACVFAAVNDGLELFNVALVEVRQHMSQMVQLVNAFVLAQMVIQAQHVAVERGNEDFFIPHPIHADALQKGLHLLRGGREFQRFAHKPPLVIFAEVGNVGFKQG